jgi:site-specific DNA recombinase
MLSSAHKRPLCDSTMERFDKELQQVERGIKRCLEFITGGDGDPGSVRDKLRKLEDRKGELASALAASKHADPVELHPNLPDLYRRKVTVLRRILDVENTRAQAIDIIRSLIDHIEINPGKEPGQCEVVVVGGLAQILAFAQQKTTAASQGDGGTFLMVAGRGFEPLTFR